MAQADDLVTAVTYSGIKFRRAAVGGVGIHYQEAGDLQRPTLLLLHGFPSTSRMWDRLIPTLACRYHVIAPDYPGFGLSDAPAPDAFTYTFDRYCRDHAGVGAQARH